MCLKVGDPKIGAFLLRTNLNGTDKKSCQTHTARFGNLRHRKAPNLPNFTFWASFWDPKFEAVSSTLDLMNFVDPEKGSKHLRNEQVPADNACRNLIAKSSKELRKARAAI